MSEIDEGLDELINSLPISTAGICAPVIITPEVFKQTILDLMCKHRGCEPEQIITDTFLGFDWLKKPVYLIEKGPCKWCGAVQRGEG